MTEQERKASLEAKMNEIKGENPSSSSSSLSVELPEDLVRIADEAVKFYAPILQEYFLRETVNKAFGGGVLTENKSFVESLSFKSLLALPSK